MAELNFNPGDSVRLRLALEELDGTVLENPDSSAILLKLSSGYNIGIPKENILASRVLKKYQEVEKEKSNLSQNSKLPKIALVITGGTIASKLDSKTGGVKPLANVEEFLSFYPELTKIVNIKKIEVPFMIASESLNIENWAKLAESIKPLIEDDEIKGIIITHGTDTLHYASAALSFFIQEPNKPIVFAYSQRSIDRGSSDANLNLQCAARMSISEVGEVMIVGHATTNDDYCYAHRGTKVRKMHSSRRDAFQSINASPIAKVWPDKIEFLSEYKHKEKNSPAVDITYTDKVALLKYYPGQEADILDYHALKHKGIIIEGTGFGHLPTSEAQNNWLPKLKKHIRNGLVVCVTTQCINGRTNPLVYSNGRELKDCGVIFLEDMHAETALMKLSWILGHYGWKTLVKDKMLENIAGEFNDRLQIDSVKTSKE